MLRETRLHRILALIAANGHISTERLIKELGISRETARRDIIELENQGAAKRVHGGLVALDSSPSEPSLKERRTRLEREKRAIARATVMQLQQGQAVFMDAGTTTTALAEELCTMPGLTIITNSLRAAMIMSERDEGKTGDSTVVLVGGRILSGREQTYGESVIEEIQRWRADVAILSPVGMDAHHGATSYLPEEAAVARCMAQRAGRLFILADHTKLGVVSRVNYASPREVSTLITDAAATEHPALKELKEILPKVILA